MEDALAIVTIFTLRLPDGTPAFFKNLFPNGIPITETVVVSWVVMAVIIALAFILTRNLQNIPKGAQTILEAAIEFLNNLSKQQFGKYWVFFSHYFGAVFLFLLVSNLIGIFTPISAFGFKAPFGVKPPPTDINVTASLACLTMLMVIICNIKAKGFLGWLKHFLYPIPFMLPFNIMDYATKLMSLALRLFGNILGGFILMELIQGLVPLAIPAIPSLYFDFFDGILQAAIFSFLSVLYVSEALEKNEPIS